MGPPRPPPCSAGPRSCSGRHQPRPAQPPPSATPFPREQLSSALSTTSLGLAGRTPERERRDRGSRRSMALDACGQAAQQVDETLTVPQMTFSDVLSIRSGCRPPPCPPSPVPRGSRHQVTAGRRVCGHRRRGSGQLYDLGLGWRFLSAILCPQKAQRSGDRRVQGLPPHWTTRKP